MKLLFSIPFRIIAGILGGIVLLLLFVGNILRVLFDSLTGAKNPFER